MKTKVCTKCGKEKPATAEYFHRQKEKSGGFRSHCKICRSRAKPKIIPQPGYKICGKCDCELFADTNNFFTDSSKKDGLATTCKSCKLESCKAWKAQNKEKANGYYRKWRKNNPEKMKEIKEQYYEKNKEIIDAKKRLYLKLNPEKRIQTIRRYKQNNLDKARQDAARRRSLKRNLPDTFTLKQWNFCKKYFGHSCAYCGKPSKKLHQEHFIAVKNGGGYTVSNIIPACQKCNVSKLDRNFFSWYPAQPFYSKLREKRILKYLKYDGQGQQQGSILEQVREEA